MSLSPGRLNQRVDIRKKTTVSNGKGGYTTSFPVLATVWAEVIGINGREALLEHVMQGVSFYRITIRWRDDVADTDQLGYGAVDLNIRSAVDPDGRREALVILADTQSTLKAA
uniref:phage head closure protein n=1 Tax=uncultured Sphingomonas sp. TaxID=158754 RepID=UPI0035CBD592